MGRQGRSRSFARVMIPNWPRPERATSKTSRFSVRLHFTRSPAPVTTSSSRALSPCVP